MDGNKDSGIPECSSCHGENAAGKDSIPRLAGQHLSYLVQQLEAFKSNLRENPIMHSNASNLTAEDIDALATYLSSL